MTKTVSVSRYKHKHTPAIKSSDRFLIETTQRYDIKGKSYIETPKKYYFSDLELRNARLNFQQFEHTQAMENIIYNNLKIYDFLLDNTTIKK